MIRGSHGSLRQFPPWAIASLPWSGTHLCRAGALPGGCERQTGGAFSRSRHLLWICTVSTFLLIGAAIAWIVRHQSPQPIHSLAVLPLRCLPMCKTEYFQDGMTEELIAELSTIPGLCELLLTTQSCSGRTVTTPSRRLRTRSESGSCCYGIRAAVKESKAAA